MRLDARGRAILDIRLPAWLPRGTRLTVAPAAWNPTLPAGLDPAMTWTFWVR